MITYLKFPTELNTVHNPIAYVLQTNLLTTKYILVRLFVETEFGSNTYKEVVTQNTVPDAEGKVTVYLDELIKAQLSYDLPNFQTTSAVYCKQTCKRFYISTSELGVNEYVGNAVYTAENNRYYALLGAFRRFEYPIRTSILPNNTQFLTRKSKELTISVRQKEWLTLLPPSNGTITINFSVQFATNTQTFSRTLTGTKFQPIHYDISFQAQNYQSLSSEAIKSITVSYLGESRTYYVSQDYYLPSCIELYYLNSLGGWDSFLCYGQHTQQIDIDRQEYQKMQLFDYQNIDSTFDVYNLVQRTNGKLFSGHLSDKQFEQYLDIFKSQKVFARLNKTVFIPINIKNKKHELQNSFEYLKGIELDYEVAYNEIVLMEEDNFTTLVTPPPPPPPPVRNSTSLRFDGLTHHVDIDYQPALDLCESVKPFTVFMDFYQTGGLKLVHTQLPSTGSYKGFFVNINNGSVDFGHNSLTSLRTVSHSIWNTRRKLAIVADTSTMQWHCYIDGELQGSFPYDFTTPQPTGAWQLGGYFRDQILQQFEGYIFDFQLFNRALSAGEVATLQTGTVSTGKIWQLEFTEGVGINAVPTVGTAGGLLKNYTNAQTSYGTTNHWVDESRNPIT